jgi:hypothetical protein
MILYHVTNDEAASAIMRVGFRDGSGSYLTDGMHTGVWLSDRPLDASEGADGDVVLRVELACTEVDLAPYEWVEQGKPYREWLVPAAFINMRSKVSPTTLDDVFK